MNRTASNQKACRAISPAQWFFRIYSNTCQVIDTAVQYIIRELNNRLNNLPTEDFVIPGNIARLESGSADLNIGELQFKVVVSVVNIEEEKTLKNSPHFSKENQLIRTFSPVLHLNIYVLFSCADETYLSALTKISRIVGFFQRQNTFTAANAAVTFPDNIEKLILDLYSMNFEQLNHLWGTMGGKYHPSVLYKMRMLLIQESPIADGDVIETVQTTVIDISNPPPTPG